MNHTSRRAAMAWTAFVSCAALLAACSSDSTSTVEGPSGSQGTTPPAEAPIPERFVGYSSETYAQPENWLCVPGADDDICATEDLTTTIVNADGTTEVEEVKPATDPSFDCFYVYPTVNDGGGSPSDEEMAADTSSEVPTVRNQAARFSEVCDVYAPLYRQLTFFGFTSDRSQELLARAADDVRDAFSYYMSEWNRGRPVLLLGHSQGSRMLVELLKSEFDGDEQLRSQLVSAMLVGGRAEIPEDGDTGASFDNLAPCRSPGQTGCVIGFNSVAADTTPQDLARWGGASAEGNVRLCTNPGDLSSDGPAPLRSIFANQGTFTVDGDVDITTPWVEFDGLLQAECVHGDATTVLLITDGGTETDQREIGGRVTSLPGWGLHVTEVGLTQGDLIDLAASQAEAMP